MPLYHKLGNIPPKRHTIFRQENGNLYHEQLFGTIGFDGMSSLMYHVEPPTIVKEFLGKIDLNPKKAIVSNLGPVINTVYPEYSPVISLDGTSLYYTSRRQWDDQSTDDYKDPQLNQYPEDIYVSYHQLDQNWTSHVRLPFCVGKVNEATVTISSDERRVYTYEDRTGNGDIYFSDFNLIPPKKVGHLVNH